MIKELFKTRFLNLFETTYLNKGKEKKWTYCSRKDKDSQNINNPDAVVIVPLLQKSNISKYKVVMVRQFRPAIKGKEISFPAGLIENSDFVYESVERELLEETGLSIKQVFDISPKLFSSSGMTDESSIICEVLAEGEPTNKNQTEDEDIEIVVVDENIAINILQGREGLLPTNAYLILRRLVDLNLLV